MESNPRQWLPPILCFLLVPYKGCIRQEIFVDERGIHPKDGRHIEEVEVGGTHRIALSTTAKAWCESQPQRTKDRQLTEIRQVLAYELRRNRLSSKDIRPFLAIHKFNTLVHIFVPHLCLSP